MTHFQQSYDSALNGICPYFTMFPLDFPLNILRERALPGDRVLDPFCGRGTTNFAARLVGLNSLGVDSSPVAAAIAASKIATASPAEIVDEARNILSEQSARQAPSSEFWQWAFHPNVLDALCRFRGGLSRGLHHGCAYRPPRYHLGALHGPKQKTFPSYFSNQSLAPMHPSLPMPSATGRPEDLSRSPSTYWP
jgi:hypothetical protein